MSLKEALKNVEKEMFKADDSFLSIDVLIEEYKNGNIKSNNHIIDLDRWDDNRDIKWFAVVITLENYGHSITDLDRYNRDWCLCLPIKDEEYTYHPSTEKFFENLMGDELVLKHLKETHNYSIREYNIRDYEDVFGYSIKPVIRNSQKRGVYQSFKMEIYRKEELFYVSSYGSKSYAEAKAKYLIEKLSDGFYPWVIPDDWKEQLKGKEVWYKGDKYIVDYIIPKQCCIIAYPEKIYNLGEDEMYKYNSLKAELWWDKLDWFDPDKY